MFKDFTDKKLPTFLTAFNINSIYQSIKKHFLHKCCNFLTSFYGIFAPLVDHIFLLSILNRNPFKFSLYISADISFWVICPDLEFHKWNYFYYISNAHILRKEAGLKSCTMGSETLFCCLWIFIPWIPTKLSQVEGPPSVDYKIGDRKVNQIYIAILGHSYIAFWEYLRRGPPFTLQVDEFKAWVPLLWNSCWQF